MLSDDCGREFASRNAKRPPEGGLSVECGKQKKAALWLGLRGLGRLA
jgi:hypothetical protein